MSQRTVTEESQPPLTHLPNAIDSPSTSIADLSHPKRQNYTLESDTERKTLAETGRAGSLDEVQDIGELVSPRDGEVKATVAKNLAFVNAGEDDSSSPSPVPARKRPPTQSQRSFRDSPKDSDPTSPAQDLKHRPKFLVPSKPNSPDNDGSMEPERISAQQRWADFKVQSAQFARHSRRKAVRSLTEARDLTWQSSVDFANRWLGARSPWLNAVNPWKKIDKERVVYCNDFEANEQQEFLTNFVQTTKYTVLTFLPKNLYEQLGKAANFYFFVLAIIVSIPGVSDLAAWTYYVPLAFVLAVSAIREAYEDYKRYKDDVEVNSRRTHVIREGKLLPVPWDAVTVGDIVKVYKDEFFPSDLICFSTSEENGECSIETSNLDGETNLKQRQSVRQTAAYRTVEQLASLQSVVRCEVPNSNLHYFEGVLQDPLGPEEEKAKEYPITHEELLMRGTQLRNTEYVYGLAIYTGKETKIFLNLNQPRHKRTNIEIVSNHQMYKIFFLLFLVCFIFAIAFQSLEIDRVHSHWYLYLDNIDTYTIGERFQLGIRDWAAFLVLYSQMVPISLYVSMELVRVAQSFLIWQDLDLYDEKTDTRAVARTAALNEQLGEIEYVFCDKTGTLTENQMAFAKCSIGGVPYGLDDTDRRALHLPSLKKDHPVDPQDHNQLLQKLVNDTEEELKQRPDLPQFKMWDDQLFTDCKRPNETTRQYMMALALCHTVQIITEEQERERQEETQKEKEQAEASLIMLSQHREHSFVGRPSSPSVHRAKPSKMPPEIALTSLPNPNVAHFKRGHSLDSGHLSVPHGAIPHPTPLHIVNVEDADAAADDANDNEAEVARHRDARKLRQHSAKMEAEFSTSRKGRPSLSRSMTRTDFQLGEIAYQSSSPDELALVTCARVFGFFFHSRERDRVKVISRAGDEAYEILHVIEFTSERKKMSVILRCPDGKVRLYCKGADSNVLSVCARDPRVNPNLMIEKTNEHLNYYSKLGLRVMCVAMREIPPDVFDDWNQRYEEASKSIGNRKELMDKIALEIERDLTLLGVTAIEDKLQDGVPETIERLKQAGMKVWILTGDKQETAVNIGKSCSLVEDQQDLQFVATGTDQPFAAGQKKRDSVFVVQNVDHIVPFEQNLDSVEEEAIAADKENDAVDEVVSEHATRVPERSAHRDTRPADNVSSEDEEKKLGGPPLTRALTAKEAYIQKVQAAKEEIPEREREIQQNLERILERFDKRQLLEQERIQRHGQDEVPEGELPEQKKARMGSALVIDGPTLAFALTENNYDTFVKVINHPQCKVVVCARLAPKQKAAVVEVVKKRVGAVTLAIGDGANDVSMIQAAHVGVGISGLEGRQAVNSSDFSIAQFRFLGKLLLVHGRYSYNRNSMLVLYMFYKNFAIAWTQLWGTIVCGMSDQGVYDGILLNTFNLFYTSLPILFVASFDRDVEPEDLMKYPELYYDRDKFSMPRFWFWSVMGFIHSIFIFFLPYYSMSTAANNDSIWSASCAVFTVLVICATIKLIVSGHNSFIIWNWVVMAVSVAFYFALIEFYTSKPLADFAGAMYAVLNKALEEGYFWFACLLASALAFLPDFAVGYIQRNYFPTGRTIIQECRRLGLPMPERPTSGSRKLKPKIIIDSGSVALAAHPSSASSSAQPSPVGSGYPVLSGGQLGSTSSQTYS